MGHRLIKRKHLDRLNKKIDEELEKAKPDHIEIIRCQRQKEKCKDWTEVQWHEQAVKNLDERVAGGESDKPLIRKRLKEKIQELKKKEG